MEKLTKLYKENENFRLFLKLLFILLMSRLVMLVLMVVYNVYMGTDRSIAFLMNQWDAKRYQFMIDNGYTFPLDTDPQANWAFFPMYVMACRFVKMLTFGVMDTYWVGMTVSTVCIFIAAFTAVKYMSLVRGGRSEDYLLIPLLMFAGPYSFYFGSVYTEAMFVLFIALFFYAAAKKKYLWAGLAAAFASATRIVGCLLVFALIVEMYLDLTQDGGKPITWAKIKSFIVQMLKMPERIFAVMLCPFGAFCYMTFLRFFCFSFLLRHPDSGSLNLLPVHPPQASVHPDGYRLQLPFLRLLRQPPPAGCLSFRQESRSYRNRSQPGPSSAPQYHPEFPRCSLSESGTVPGQESESENYALK